MRKPLTYSDLKDVVTDENNEPLVDLKVMAPEIVCVPINQDMRRFCEDKMLVREGVAKLLKRAAKRLEKRERRAQIKVVYGYRHPDIQREYFKEITEKLIAEYPSTSKEELYERAHSVVAVPEVAGHPTGGAVDVTITAVDGEWDMGTPIWDLKALKLIPTFSSLVSEKARSNRMVLRDVMLAEGFAPFDGEWWHFSMGDKEWAAYYGKPNAFYSEIRL